MTIKSTSSILLLFLSLCLWQGIKAQSLKVSINDKAVQPNLVVSPVVLTAVFRVSIYVRDFTAFNILLSEALNGKV